MNFYLLSKVSSTYWECRYGCAGLARDVAAIGLVKRRAAHETRTQPVTKKERKTTGSFA
jgi:hypothetical protein